MANGNSVPSVSLARWALHPSEMVDWFKYQVQRFFTLPARIASLQRAAQQVTEKASQVGRPDLAAQASDINTNLTQTATNQASIQNRVRDFLSKLGALGINLPGLGEYGYPPPSGLGILPAIPIALIAAGVVVALGIASVIKDYANQEAALNRVAQGVMTPDEAARLIRGTSKPLFGLDIGGALKPLVLIGGLAAALYFFGPQIRKAMA